MFKYNLINSIQCLKNYCKCHVIGKPSYYIINILDIYLGV
jgi:hypothetical protein